jgi:predicted enzyme related to lactoylglutathione lyase
MEKVNGIGGVFFRARDPQALAQWYEDNLGVRKTGASYEEGSWWQETGPTVFAPFADDTEYFDRPAQAWMINFRVDDLDAIAAQLRAAGVDVVIHEPALPNGRFGRCQDPEGNPIELWEPAGPDLSRPG